MLCHHVFKSTRIVFPCITTCWMSAAIYMLLFCQGEVDDIKPAEYSMENSPEYRFVAIPRSDNSDNRAEADSGLIDRPSCACRLVLRNGDGAKVDQE